jgi:exodeoxyribonuclease X
MIPPQASAVHHITDLEVMYCPSFEDRLPYYLDVFHAEVDVFAAHNWRFESQWLGAHLDGRPAICTYKCALRVWPDAPAHSNQALRYWLRPEGLSPLIASVALLLRRVGFGKHRGEPWSEVPSDYLSWVVGKPDMSEDVKFTAQHYLRQRREAAFAPGA